MIFSDDLSPQFDRELLFREYALRTYQRIVAFGVARFRMIPGLAAKQHRPILRYQRVLNPEEEMYPVALNQYVRPQTFLTHLEYLKHHCRVLPLADYLEALARGTSPSANTVVLTFDCGWVDTFSNVYPQLKRFGFPATVFLPTSFIGTSNLFWPEKLVVGVLAVFGAGHSLSTLPFFRETFPEMTTDTPEDYDQTVAKVSVVVRLLLQMNATDRTDFLSKLGILIEELGGFPDLRLHLSWDEVTEMARGGITFASAGHAHRAFHEMGPSEVAIDLSTSLQELTRRGITPLPAVAAPYGIWTKESLAVLPSISVTTALGLNAPFPQSDSPLRNIRLLSRMPIYEAVSYTPELFACRAWDINALGCSFGQ